MFYFHNHNFFNQKRIKSEEISKRYDAIVVSRYPDSLRKYAASQGFTPWKNSKENMNFFYIFVILLE